MQGSEVKLDEVAGYLHKQSPRFPFPWQKRFFEVQTSPKPLILYFVKPGDVAPRGCLHANKIADVRASSTRPTESRFVIRLTSSTRKYKLRAETPVMRRKWVRAIRALMMRDSSPPPPKETERETHGDRERGSEGKRVAAGVRQDEDAKMLHVNERVMRDVHKLVVDTLLESSNILQRDPNFQLFALHMQKGSYFELGEHVPIFRDFFRGVLAPEFQVAKGSALALDDINSLDLEKTRFDVFLKSAARSPFAPGLRADRYDSLLRDAARRSTAQLQISAEEARKVDQLGVGVVKGLSALVELMNILAE